MTTVRWLIAQRRLRLRLHAGAAGLDRELDCAVSSELVRAADWLAGGEVLLTTGLRLPPDGPGRREYLTSLDGAGVAAVGFALGLGFDEVPAELVAAAEEVGMPLFEVPLPIPFSAITRAVLDQIAAQRSARLLAATRSQPRLTRAAAASGAAALIPELADAVGQRVMLLDVGGGVVRAAPDDPRPDDLERVRALVARDPSTAGAVRITDDAAITVARVSSGSRAFGHLGVIGSGALDDSARMLIGHAVSLLAIEYARPRKLQQDIARLHADAFELAVNGHRSEHVVRIVERAAGADGLLRAVVFVFADDAAARSGTRRLADDFERRWRPVFIRCIGSEVSALLRGDDPGEFALGLLGQLGAHGPVAGGIGPAVGVAEVGESVQRARLASRSAAHGQLVDLDDANSLLTVDPVRQALAASYPQRLAPLLAYDREHGTELRASLLAYLEANGHWGSAAAALRCHRHTLRHRVTRIEELLSVDLDDARSRAELLLILLGGSVR